MATVTTFPSVQAEPPAVIPSEFRQALRDALAHLHDLPFLRQHTLTPWLLPENSGNQGERLRDLLLVAIDELRPSDSVPGGASAWRRYYSLQLRYVAFERPSEAADTMAMSERQARREHHEALEVLAVRLWQRRSEATAFSAFAEAAERDPRDAAPFSNLAGTVASLRETLGPLLREQGAEIDVRLLECLPDVAVDRVTLRQALLTVLLTGIEHGGRQFQVTASTGADGVLLRLGMEEHLPPSFASMLTPANRLLAERGGTARVRIDPVDGAVLFSLPRRQSLILLVDDDPDFARLFERCLAGSPYSLATSPAGADVVARTQALRPAVIVLDVFLPSQDGWEVLQHLKGEGTTHTVPVLICSALANPALARTLGAAGCLPKPVTPRTLLAALERCQA